MKSYRIQPVPSEIECRGTPPMGPWEEITPVHLACHPWYEGERLRITTVRAAYTPRRLHILFQCKADQIHATRTRFNSAVCLDSCVEFFASLQEDDGRYFNLEMNCCGTIHLGYGSHRNDRRLAGNQIVDKIKVISTIPGPTKAVCPVDNEWTLQAALPFKTLSEMAGIPVAVDKGTRWRANFYRCGDPTPPYHLCWNAISSPGPDFHRPEYFGELIFQ
ncbi:MAG: carbohydrate-binding family 9-like protein [Candidatus Brocadiia bacterium]